MLVSHLNLQTKRPVPVQPINKCAVPSEFANNFNQFAVQFIPHSFKRRGMNYQVLTTSLLIFGLVNFLDNYDLV